MNKQRIKKNRYGKLSELYWLPSEDYQWSRVIMCKIQLHHATI